MDEKVTTTVMPAMSAVKETKDMTKVTAGTVGTATMGQASQNTAAAIPGQASGQTATSVEAESIREISPKNRVMNGSHREDQGGEKVTADKWVTANMNLESYLRCVPEFSKYKNAMPQGEPTIAIDIGSTTQRCVLFNLVDDEQQSQVLSTPTEYALVNKDISNTASGSPCPLDNLEVIINCKDPSDATAIKQAHIVKNTLLRKLNLPQRALTSDIAKVDAESTYMNILVNVATVLLSRAIAGEATVGSRVFDVDLTVSLPPDDAVVRSRTDLFKDKLKGTYEVDFVRLGIKVQFRLNPASIYIGSEPLAAALQQLIGLDLPEDNNYLFVDCGGRSLGIIPFVDENLREGSAAAFAIGGTTLLNELADEIASKLKIQRPRPEMMVKVLETGLFKTGAKSINVVEQIENAKQSIAERLDLSIAQALSGNSVQGADFARVYCSGGTFGVTTDAKTGTVVSDSIMAKLRQLYAAKSPFTEFFREPNRETVAKGLVWVRMRYIQG